ncbi:MAG: diacylglycerol kinase [Gemmatimonadetes bacterium]|nr:diacylglycerol kinase [Gemmatimonadota bacterium]
MPHASLESDDLPAAGSRRFLFLLAAASPASAHRRLQAVLERAALWPQARVAIVAAVAEAARQLRPGEIPVAVGGDGTANLVARALREAGAVPVMGLLPLGTGNALAHALGAGRVDTALEALRAGRPQAIDVMVTAHPLAPLALATLSAGFEGNYLMRYAGLRGRGRVQAGLRALRSAFARSGGIALTVDGTVLSGEGERVFSAGLYNIPCYAGGHTVWPAADPGDGEAEAVVCTTALAYWRTLALGLRTDRPGARGSRRFCRWRTAHLECASPIQFDGESANGGNFDVRLEPSALGILAPARHLPD